MFTSTIGEELFKILMSNMSDKVKESDNGCKAPYNIYKKPEDSTVYVEMMVPGFTRDEIKVSIKEDKLEVKCEPSPEEDEESNEYKARFFGKPSLKNVFKISTNSDVDNIETRLKNGVLYITVPKDKSKQRDIPVR